MTLADVLARVEAIKAAAGDWESTHLMSDSLWADVLRSIAAGTAEDPAALASAAVSGVTDLKFERWYA
jgi:hypothetical protein